MNIKLMPIIEDTYEEIINRMRNTNDPSALTECSFYPV
jgi:hypothetical protein